TIIYTIFAIELGEIMYQLGVLTVMLDKIRDRLEKPCNLIITTLLSCLATVMLTTSQYMAILLPGEVFQDSYKKANVAPQILSRTLEDGGTLFAFLVPWSAAAIYSSGVLGVSAVEYLPFAFLPLLCPLFAVVCAITGIGVFDCSGNSLRGKTGKRVESAEITE
ncbi:MAG: Na+/H+ antiporter NhaC family protein, partial [Oscillospiraceae bacterium]|nr:Na+/H+ antiporter NhaC family protein [Oscillospiraceae bacterium]